MCPDRCDRGGGNRRGRIRRACRLGCILSHGHCPQARPHVLTFESDHEFQMAPSVAPIRWARPKSWRLTVRSEQAASRRGSMIVIAAKARNRDPMIDTVINKLEIPRRLRAVVRARESSLVVLAALVGSIAGLVVTAMGTGVDTLHRLLFHLEPGVRLSGLLKLDPMVAISVPLLGGIAFGMARELIAQWRPEREIDPIEANALHGGRMSLLGSVIVAAERCGRAGWERRSDSRPATRSSPAASRPASAWRFGCGARDLRILVGCGAAGGIAGAFGAPLAGAFLRFELIIGGYTPNQPGAGRRRRVDRLPGRADARRRRTRRRAPAMVVTPTPRSRDRGLCRAVCAAAGIADHAGASQLRGVVLAAEAAFHLRTALGGLWSGCSRVAPAGDVFRPRRIAFSGMFQLSPRHRRAAFRAQDRRLSSRSARGFAADCSFPRS